MGKIPVKRRRYLLQFSDRCPRIETVDDSLEFQVGHVRLMPERRRRKGMWLGAWGHFMRMRRVETALPASGKICFLYIVNRAGGLPLQVRESVIMIRHV